MYTIPECCFPNCHSTATVKVKLPLCDRHMVRAYRAVQSLMTPAARLAAVERIVEESEEDLNRPGVVYFVQFADRVKIGFTTDLARRMHTVPHDRILATFAGTYGDEGALHRRFEHLNIKGEWFRMGDDLMAHIDQVKQAA